MVESVQAVDTGGEETEFRALLKDHVKRSTRRPGAVATMAIRHRASSYRDILAFQATGLKLTFAELRDKIAAKISIRGYVDDPHVLAELGRVVLLQNLYEDDVRVGEVLLSVAIDILPSDQKSRVFRRLLAQHDLLTGNLARAKHLTELYPDIDRDTYHHLRTDLMNPFLTGNFSDYETWIKDFNAPFREHNLLPVRVGTGEGMPFDRLTSSVPYRTKNSAQNEQLVSVVITSYRPTEDSLVASITSLLNQTWSNLEIVVVNDSSGPDYLRIFERIKQLDARIRVLETPANSGTYIARNLGFGAAHGTYLTGQDDDDWSHPERIEKQVAHLEAHSEFSGCRVHSIASAENLVLTRIGKATPKEPNASSLMLHRKVWEEVGGFLPVRKAADNELFHRVQQVTQKEIVDLESPLTIIRKADGSLSHAEFSAGWRHPSRRHFRTAYTYWHKIADDSEMRILDDTLPQIAVPNNFKVETHQDDSFFDVIFAGDWSPFGGPQRSMLEEIKALVKAGKKIGVMHLDPARFMMLREREMCDEIVALINSGVVTNVLYDDSIQTELLILRYPPIMQFPPAMKSAIRPRKTIILANQAPKEVDGSDIRYIPSMVHRNTIHTFNSPVSWVPQSALVRDALTGRLEASAIEGIDMPGILDIDEWFVKRRRFRSSIPVVGRHSRDNVMKWPEKESTLKAAYPIDGTFDVRILGGATAPLSVLKQKHIPGSWTVYEPDQMNPKKFLGTLDFYIFFQHKNAVEAFGRAILEALASGLVVILPHKFKRVFGDAAVYCLPAETVKVIRHFYENRERYEEQVQKSLKYLNEHFSYSSYVELVETLQEEQRATAY